MLLIHRIGWFTKISLKDFSAAYADPKATAMSIRLFGNGGFFSFTGLYANRRIGRYRAFITDTKRSVVLVFSERKIVVSPEHPEVFIVDITKITEQGAAANP